MTFMELAKSWRDEIDMFANEDAEYHHGLYTGRQRCAEELEVLVREHHEKAQDADFGPFYDMVLKMDRQAIQKYILGTLAEKALAACEPSEDIR